MLPQTELDTGNPDVSRGVLRAVQDGFFQWPAFGLTAAGRTLYIPGIRIPAPGSGMSAAPPRRGGIGHVYDVHQSGFGPALFILNQEKDHDQT